MLFPCLYAWKMPWCSQRTSKHSFCLLSSLVPSVVLLLKSHPSTPDSKDVAVLFLSHFGSWPQGLHVIPSILTLDRLLFSWESRLSWELKKKNTGELKQNRPSLVSLPLTSSGDLRAPLNQYCVLDKTTVHSGTLKSSWIMLLGLTPRRRAWTSAVRVGQEPSPNCLSQISSLVITSVTFQNSFLRESGAFEPARSLN